MPWAQIKAFVVARSDVKCRIPWGGHDSSEVDRSDVDVQRLKVRWPVCENAIG